MSLKTATWKTEVNGTTSGSRPRADFGFSGVEHSRHPASVLTACALKYR